ncbi:MAG: hypothetical protein WC393_05245 [Candidatus Nanoarchaeia archaeon]|jgi:predicted membrane protein (TIGR00267 family)
MSFVKTLFKDDIVRRYFVMNTFDGVLSGIGILIALLISRIYETRIIIISCMGSGIAMAISGIWGAYLIERAERKHKLIKNNLEKNKQLINENIKKSIIVGLVDGISPLLAILFLISPFFLTDVMTAYAISFIISAIIIAFLGVFIAKIGKQKILISIAKLLLAAVTVTVIIYLMEMLKII